MNYLFKSRASSLAKLAQLPRYQHPADLLNLKDQPIKKQLQQIEGKLELNHSNYISIHHQQLMKNLVNSRQEYSRLKDGQSSKVMQIADKQFGFWNQYSKNLLNSLAEEQKLNSKHKQNMYESFLITKARNEQKLSLDRFTSFMYQYTRAFKVDFPVHPLVLTRMVHPHFGYLTLFKQKLTIEQIFDLWHEMIIVSLVRYQGYSLHASELMSFYFWKLQLQQRGYMSFEDFCKFLNSFKFSIKGKQSFQKMFKFTLQKRTDFKGSSDVIRFDLWRNIYVDHDL